MKDDEKTKEPQLDANAVAAAHLSLALDQVLAKVDRSRVELIKKEVLANIDRAIAW